MANRVHRLTHVGVRYCPGCREVKPLQEFIGGSGYCAQCREDNAKEALESLKAEVFKALGGACKLCDERDPELLSFNQLRPNGFQGTLSYVHAHNYPKEFWLQCKDGCKV